MKTTDFTLWKTSLLFILIPILNSCNKSASGFGGIPYYQGCKIEGNFGKLETYEISEYLKTIKDEVKKEIPFSENLRELLLTETIDGGDSIHDLKLVLFNEKEIIPIKVKYTFVNRMTTTKDITIGNLSHRAHKKILKTYRKLKDYGEWNISIECLSFSNEQEATFYLKEGNNYIYFANFENFYFAENPGIGIDKGIMDLIEIMENI